MPAKSAKQYGLMQAALHGSVTGKVGRSGPTRATVREFVDSTPAKKRSKFAKSLRSKKKGDKQ
jgi:hypothetical protein